MRIWLHNYGNVPLTGIPCNYSFNGGSPVSQTYNGPEIDPGDSVLFMFAQPLLPLTQASGPLCAWTSYTGDMAVNNDTSCVNINMVVGIIVDDTIHFLSKYLRGRREYRLGPEDAIRYAFHEAGSAMIVTTAILASGFAILATSSFLPNATMSLLTTIAIVLALPVDLLLLPLLVLLIDRDKTPVAEALEPAHDPVPAK